MNRKATDSEFEAAMEWCFKYRDMHQLARKHGLVLETTCHKVNGPNGPDTLRLTVKIGDMVRDMGRPPPFAFELLSKAAEQLEGFKGVFTGPVEVQWVQ